MVQIQSVPIWNNGQIKDASWLNANCINDNLSTQATFYYQLCEDSEGQSGQMLADGNLTMTGQDYLNWNDIDYAYNWIANQLSLTIIQ